MRPKCPAVLVSGSSSKRVKTSPPLRIRVASQRGTPTYTTHGPSRRRPPSRRRTSRHGASARAVLSPVGPPCPHSPSHGSSPVWCHGTPACGYQRARSVCIHTGASQPTAHRTAVGSPPSACRLAAVTSYKPSAWASLAVTAATSNPSPSRGHGSGASAPHTVGWVAGAPGGRKSVTHTPDGWQVHPPDSSRGRGALSTCFLPTSAPHNRYGHTCSRPRRPRQRLFRRWSPGLPCGPRRCQSLCCHHRRKNWCILV